MITVATSVLDRLRPAARCRLQWVLVEHGSACLLAFALLIKPTRGGLECVVVLLSFTSLAGCCPLFCSMQDPWVRRGGTARPRSPQLGPAMPPRQPYAPAKGLLQSTIRVRSSQKPRQQSSSSPLTTLANATAAGQGDQGRAPERLRPRMVAALPAPVTARGWTGGRGRTTRCGWGRLVFHTDVGRWRRALALR